MDMAAWLSRPTEAHRPAKRLKVADSVASDDETSDASGQYGLPVSTRNHVLKHENSLSEGDDDSPGGDSAPTPHDPAYESSLPPVETDAEAIEEYEVLRASQASAPDETVSSRFDSRKWVRGKSSIYVDAFNLALDTVLEAETHLFSEKEVAVFQGWRNLDYEAQYLSVLLVTPAAAS